MRTHVELVGGPLDGEQHELMDPGFGGIGGEPARIGMNIGGKVVDGGRVAWYERGDDGKYRFMPEAPKRIIKERE
jgi:hypothetical protein